MLMSPLKLVALRLFNMTLGRSPRVGALLRSWAVRRMVTGSSRPYCQCSEFFEPCQLDEPRSRQ